VGGCARADVGDATAFGDSAASVNDPEGARTRDAAAANGPLGGVRGVIESDGLAGEAANDTMVANVVPFSGTSCLPWATLAMAPRRCASLAVTQGVAAVWCGSWAVTVS